MMRMYFLSLRARGRFVEVFVCVSVIVLALCLFFCKVYDGRTQMAIELDTQRRMVYYREYWPLVTTEEALTVVFLTGGQYFSSNEWASSGILKAMSRAGHRAIAVDVVLLDDNSAPAELADSEVALILLRFLSTLRINNYAMVAPSYSCPYALPLLVRADTGLRDFIVISPTGTDLFSPVEYTMVPARVLVVYNRQDQQRVDDDSWRHLKNIRRVKSVAVKGNNMPFSDNPTLFVSMVTNYLKDNHHTRT